MHEMRLMLMLLVRIIVAHILLLLLLMMMLLLLLMEAGIVLGSVNKARLETMLDDNRHMFTYLLRVTMAMTVHIHHVKCWRLLLLCKIGRGSVIKYLLGCIGGRDRSSSGGSDHCSGSGSSRDGGSLIIAVLGTGVAVATLLLGSTLLEHVCLLGVRAVMSMKVVRATKAFTTAREMADMRSFASVDKHVALEVLVTLEAPSAVRIRASMLMLSIGTGQLSTRTATRSSRRLCACRTSAGSSMASR